MFGEAPLHSAFSLFRFFAFRVRPRATARAGVEGRSPGRAAGPAAKSGAHIFDIGKAILCQIVNELATVDAPQSEFVRLAYNAV